MKAVVQRVKEAWVRVNGEEVGRIGRGLLALVGFEKGDAEVVVPKLADKLVNLRVFEDASGRMNLSVQDVDGGVLLVPNFTLAGDARKGRRPSFDGAMEPGKAEIFFEALVRSVEATGVPTAAGVFGAHMEVGLVNEGPVTIVLEM